MKIMDIIHDDLETLKKTISKVEGELFPLGMYLSNDPEKYQPVAERLDEIIREAIIALENVETPKFAKPKFESIKDINEQLAKFVEEDLDNLTDESNVQHVVLIKDIGNDYKIVKVLEKNSHYDSTYDAECQFTDIDTEEDEFLALVYEEDGALIDEDGNEIGTVKDLKKCQK